METYKSAGVDIDAADRALSTVKSQIKSTFTSDVISDVGHFGAMFDARFPGYEFPVLVSSTDGVGTKIKVAALAKRYDTIGQDLVNHCINDILACGAVPLYFMDYFAAGVLDPDVTAAVIGGVATACKIEGVALIGGETAEMPDVYAAGDFDLAGTIVGVVEKNNILSSEHVVKDDVLIALPSTGLHTNGFSLARKVLLASHALSDTIEGIGVLADALLAVHKCYLQQTKPLLSLNLLKAISHVTGGGIESNTKRVIPKELSLEIDWQSWQQPPIFSLIESLGSVPTDDMRRTFNLGAGIIYIVSPEKVNDVLSLTAHENPWVIGRVS